MYVRSQNSLLQYDLMGWSYPCKASILVWPATKADTMCWSSLHLVIDVRGSTPFSRLSTIYIHRPFMSTSCLLIESLIRVTSKEPEISAYWHNLNAFSTHQLPSTTINLHLPGCGNKIDANLFLSLAVAPLPFTKRNGTRWRRKLGSPPRSACGEKTHSSSSLRNLQSNFLQNRMKKRMAHGSPCKVKAKSVKANIYHHGKWTEKHLHGFMAMSPLQADYQDRHLDGAPLRSPHSPFFLLQKSGRSRLFQIPFLSFQTSKLRSVPQCLKYPILQLIKGSSHLIRGSELSTQWGHSASRLISTNSRIIKAQLARFVSRLKSKFWDFGHYRYIDILDSRSKQESIKLLAWLRVWWYSFWDIARMGLSGLNQGSVQIQVIELARSQHALEDIERIWVKVRDVSWNPMNFPQFCCFWEARFRSAYGLVAISAVLAKLRLPHRGGNSDLSSCSGDAACTAHVIAIAQGRKAARPGIA